MVKWTYENCKIVTQSCNTLKEFRTKYNRAYYVVNKNNWHVELCSHMIKYDGTFYWTIEKSIKKSLKYSNRHDFFTFSCRAYEVLRSHGLLNMACKHMKKPYEDTFKWSKEKCGKIAIKYNFRKEFQIGDKRAYEAALNNGWLNDICQHMAYKKLPNGYWNNIENCKKRALEYKTRKDFIKKSPHVYTKSLKMGWVDEICKHMISVGDKYNRCIYSYEFPDNHVYVGLTCNLTRRQYDRNSDKNDAVTKYINKSGLSPIRKQLTDYIPVDKAMRLEGEHLNNYINEGWKILNRIKTGGLGGSNFK